jgi:hypothetical protein
MHLSCMWTIIEVIDFWANPNYLVRKGTQKNVALRVAVLHVFKYFKCYQNLSDLWTAPVTMFFQFRPWQSWICIQEASQEPCSFCKPLASLSRFHDFGSERIGWIWHDMTVHNCDHCDPWNLKQEIGWNMVKPKSSHGLSEFIRLSSISQV